MVPGNRVKNHAIGMAGRADTREAADVLARAFHNDPVFSWMLPAEDTRNRRWRRYFVTELRHESLRQGGVEVARDSGRITGAAAWFPPGTWSGTEVGALPGYLRAFGRRLDVCSRFMSVAVRAHPREQPHWYLAIIGVDPSRRDSRVGAALLRSRLERCDEEGTAAYLESSNPQNVPPYEHFGFQVNRHTGLAGGRARRHHDVAAGTGPLNRRVLLDLGDSRARATQFVVLEATGPGLNRAGPAAG